MKTSVKLLLAFATAAAAIAPAAAQQVVAWDEAYRQADARIAQLTLDEKISFMRGYSSFFFYGVPEKGMPYIYLSDATQGVHMRDNLSDPTMVRQLERSTAFPCPISLAATFNPSLAYRYAEAVGEECRAGGIEVLLGPGMNIYRNSQNGRNFEYMGEDPLLASAMVAEYVKGMQSTGTVACLKHFICNETEFYRRRSNSIVDERALHELYLPPFKAGIDAGVGYVMTSYNRLNGEWAGQNADLIRRILRGELGFRGCVMSDWSSVNDTEKVVKSGQNVEMPGRKEFFGEVRALLKEGRITEKDIEKMIRPNIATSIAFGLYDREKYVPALLEKFPAHKQTGYDVAAEGIVLLRNNGILPLAEGRKILLTGRFTEQIPRTGGSTSSSAEVLGYDNVTLTAALREVYGERLAAVYDKSSQTVPYKAGLNAVDGYLMGKVAAPTQEVSENGHRFLVNWEEGQKTGFFLDQRCNRELVERYAAGRTVLNTFCYTGGFSVYAAAGGAKEVCSVDASERAVQLADENMRLNFGDSFPHTTLACDAVEYLKQIGDRYDLIILDPPAFAKHHKVLGNAMQGYKRLNARALSQIRPGGILFTFSCSQAVTKELFRTTVFSAAAIAGRKVRILHQLTQPADHPINIYHPEGEYLKGLVLYVE